MWVVNVQVRQTWFLAVRKTDQFESLDHEGQAPGGQPTAAGLFEISDPGVVIHRIFITAPFLEDKGV
jgi:hypothetical protein